MIRFLTLFLCITMAQAVQMIAGVSAWFRKLASGGKIMKVTTKSGTVLPHQDAVQLHMAQHREEFQQARWDQFMAEKEENEDCKQAGQYQVHYPDAPWDTLYAMAKLHRLHPTYSPQQLYDGCSTSSVARSPTNHAYFDSAQMRQRLRQRYSQADDEYIQIVVDALSNFPKFTEESLRSDQNMAALVAKLEEFENDGLLGPHYGVIPQQEVASMLKTLTADLDMSMLAQHGRQLIQIAKSILEDDFSSDNTWTTTRPQFRARVEQVKNAFMQQLQKVEFSSTHNNVCLVDTLYSFVTQEGCEKRAESYGDFDHPSDHEARMWQIKQNVYDQAPQSGISRSLSGLRNAHDFMNFDPAVVRLILREIHHYIESTGGAIAIDLSGPIAFHSLLAPPGHEGGTFEYASQESFYFPRGVLDHFTQGPVQNGYLLMKGHHWSNLRPTESTHGFYADQLAVRRLEVGVQRAREAERMGLDSTVNEIAVEDLQSRGLINSCAAQALAAKLNSDDAFRSRFMTAYQTGRQELMQPLLNELH